MNFILASIGVFLVTILVLVVILLVAKNFLVASGSCKEFPCSFRQRKTDYQRR